MRELLTTMFTGWCIHHTKQAAGDESFTLDEAMIEACGGDERAAALLTVFGHCGNDVVSIAAHYGVGLALKQPDGTLVYEDGTIDTLLQGGVLTIVNVPPAPSPDHYWHAGVWNVPDKD